jgi:hypothetical protein
LTVSAEARIAAAPSADPKETRLQKESSS